MSAHPVYADYAASAPLRPQAAAAVAAALAEAGNPSSPHRAGAAQRRTLEGAREVVAAALGAHPLEIVFTSGATEANNLALVGVLGSRAGRGRLAIPETEHSSVREPARALAGAGHAVVVLAVTPEGRVAPAAARAAAPDLLAAALVNAETGVIQDVPALAAAVHAGGGLLHVDAAQAAGTLALDVEALGADLLTLSGHKLGGPPGAGALFVRRGTPIRAVLHGGPQERGLRPGTENVPAIAGLAAALAAAVGERAGEAVRLGALSARLRAGITRLWPAARLAGAAGASGAAPRAIDPVVPSSMDPVAPHIVNATFPGLDGEALLAGLDLEGVRLSAGSACAAGAAEPSHVLLAMGWRPEEARSALRFSLGWASTDADVDDILTRLARVLGRVHPRTRETAWPALAS